MEKSSVQKTLEKEMNKGRIAKDKVSLILKYVLLVVLTVFFIFPFVFMVSKSLMSNKESYSLPVRFFPSEISFEGYKGMFDENMLTWLGNTMFVVIFNCISVPFSAAMCAYGFSRIKFAGSGKLFAFVLATIMLPSIVVQIPLYVIFSKLNWTGTLLPVTIPSLFGGGATSIFLIIQFMRNIPKDIENAAKIDGASTFRIFLFIMIPLIMPVLIFLMVNTFLGNWNDFMGPLIYLSGNPDKYTLAIGIYYKFMGGLSRSNFPNQQMAVGLFMCIPPLVLFIVFQKQLIEGVSFGAIKG